MKDFLDRFITEKEVKAFKSYLRAVAAAAVTMGIALLSDMRPEYAVLIGALAGPLMKWADKQEKEYGLGSEKDPMFDEE
jgi:hypothetical protein